MMRGAIRCIDGLADIDLKSLVAFHRMHGRLATVTAVSPIARFGSLQLDGERVVQFAEKPELSVQRQKAAVDPAFTSFGLSVYYRQYSLLDVFIPWSSPITRHFALTGWGAIAVAAITICLILFLSGLALFSKRAECSFGFPRGHFLQACGDPCAANWGIVDLRSGRTVRA
jgi:hypothetical protein